MPELEDFTEQLKEIRKAKGIDEKNVPTELKIGVINEKKNTQNTQNTQNTNNNISSNNNTVQIPISTSPPPQTQQNIKEKPKNTNNNNNNNSNKRDEDNFGCGLFKRGFLKRHRFTDDEPKKNINNNINNNSKTKEKEKEKEKEKKNEPIDLTHIKSNPGTTTKTNILNTFNNDLKTNVETSKINSGMLNNLANNKQQWLNQELLMKIAQNPNLMRCFMDPRFSTVIQELQANPQECLKKYGNNPEFSNFIKEFSALMGDHFNNLAKNPMAGNPNYNTPEVQEIVNDPKIKPILERLQKEGRIDMNEIQRDPYIASRFKVLIDKKILNIQKMD